MHEPKGWQDYLSPNTWAWFMAGRPNPMQRGEQIADHYGWLVDLGSFESRDFYLHHSTMDQRGWQRLNSFLTNTTFADTHWQLKTVPDRPSVVAVVACRKDMQTWEGIFRRFDAEETK